MRKAGIISVVLIVFLLTACSNTATTQETKPSYDEIETQLQEVIKERDTLKSELESLKAEVEKEKEKVTVQDNDVTILVTDKTVTPKNSDKWIFSNYVNFVFSITNNTEKDIQGIQGELTIRDLFGDDILTMGCDFTGEDIPYGATVVNDELSFECNEFISEHM